MADEFAKWGAGGTSDAQFVGSSGASGVFTAGGSSAVQWAGRRLRVATAPLAFTFLPLGGPTWEGTVRREPEVLIQKALNDSPSSTTFTDEEDSPLGANVQLDMLDGFGVVAGGTVQSKRMRYEGRTDALAFDLGVADYLFLLNKRRPFASFVDTSATIVAQYIFDNFAPFGFTADIEPNLPPITVLFDGSLDYSGCMSQICSLIQGYFKVDNDRVVYLFLEDPTPGPAVIDDNNMLLIRDQPLTVDSDISQLRNRVFVKGDAANLMLPTAPGATVLEVDGVDIFSETGGQGIINGDVFSYTGFQRTFVYPPPDASSFTPGGLVAFADNNQCGRIKTRVRYLVAFVIEGKASQLGPVSAPAEIFQMQGFGGSISSIEITPAGGQVPFAASSWIFGAYDQLGGIAVNGMSFGTSGVLNPTQSVKFNGLPIINDPRAGGRIAWRRELVGATKFREAFRVPAPAPTATDVKADASLGPLIPHTNPAEDGNGASQYNTTGCKSFIYGVPIGPTGTSARRIYRQEQYGYDVFNPNNSGAWTEPELCMTIDDNVTQGAPGDMIEDTKPTRVFSWSSTVNPGNPLPPPPPPPPPKLRLILVGVTGLDYAHEESDDVAIWIQRDDFASQLSMATIEGGDGVHEYLIADSKLRSNDALAARGDAELALFAQPIITVRYSSFDPHEPGGTVEFNLSRPPIVGTLKVMEVRIDKVHYQHGHAPRYNVTASSVRFTLQDLLRRAILRPY